MKSQIKAYFKLREQRKLTKHIKNILSSEQLTLLDIGAAGNIENRWKRISTLVNYIGFEPDERSYYDLLKKPNKCANYTLHQKAVWSKKGAISFHLTRGWQQSSHYQPNLNFVDNFPKRHRFDLIKKLKMKTETIDNLVDEKIDFIKIDAQGGELEILKGANKSLEDVMGLELEVALHAIYLNQPMFHDVVNIMVEKDFVFIDFISLRRWERSNLYSSMGQLVFGDAIFLRSPEWIIKYYGDNIQKLRRYIAICSLYNRFDIIEAVLQNMQPNFKDEKLVRAIFILKKRMKRFETYRRISDIITKLFGSEYNYHALY